MATIKTVVKGGALLGAGWGVGLVCGVALARMAPQAPEQPATTSPELPVASAAQPLPAAVVPEKTAGEAVLENHSFEEASSWSRAYMKDSTDSPSLGAYTLAVWLAERGTLTDVAVERDETSVKLAKKDIAQARGKRTCVRGRVVQVVRDATYPKPLYSGTLATSSYDFVHYLAAGSSGTLVSGNSARLCGVVTGLFTYDNLGGNKTDAVQMVGMFDLPENRR